jgi:hypothetical protein
MRKTIMTEQTEHERVMHEWSMARRKSDGSTAALWLTFGFLAWGWAICWAIGG